MELDPDGDGTVGGDQLEEGNEEMWKHQRNGLHDVMASHHNSAPALTCRHLQPQFFRSGTLHVTGAEKPACLRFPLHLNVLHLEVEELQ